MPNSKNPHSVSDSQHPNQSSLTAYTNGHQYDETSADDTQAESRSFSGNGHRSANPVNGSSGHLTPLPSRQIDVDPVAEPSFLEAAPEINVPPEPDDATAVTVTRAPDHYASQSKSQIPTPAESTVAEPARVSRSLRLQWRFWRTLVFAAWIFARVLFWQIYVNRVFPGYVDRTNLKRWAKYAREFRRFAIARGGVFIKLGQFISTRVDILPEEIIRELEALQDEVPTIRFARIEAVLREELGDINQYFAWISQEPVAAASLGQVHRAQLRNDERVVVKVQRPGIRNICYTDLAAMRVVARVAMQFRFISRRADARGLVEEFGTVLLEELSYKHEAYNAARFQEIFKDDPGVYIPSVYYNLSTDRVLTMEDVTSIKISDFDALDRAGISRKAVAKRLMDTYLPQVFNHYFFHADPHPGNLFIYPLPVPDENADFGPEGRPFYLIFIDFGMTGSLTHEIADGMVTTLYSVLTRDAEGLINSYQKLGFLLPGADVDRIIEAARTAFDQVWGLSMAELRSVDYDRIIDLANEFNDLMLSMPFYIPQDFIYLGRTISILSGMCTSLDPQFNPWLEMEPYTETLIARGFGMDIPRDRFLSYQGRLSIVTSLFSGNGSKVLRTVGEEMVRRALGPLSRADDTLKQLQKGDLRITADLSVAHRQQLRRIEKESRTTSRAVFFGSMLITSTLFYLNGDTTIAAIGYILCTLTLIVGVLKE
ncbi:MAG: ABC1 kinase family protein [Chloroflexota bacterium]